MGVRVEQPGFEQLHQVEAQQRPDELAALRHVRDGADLHAVDPLRNVHVPAGQIFVDFRDDHGRAHVVRGPHELPETRAVAGLLLVVELLQKPSGHRLNQADGRLA